MNTKMRGNRTNIGTIIGMLAERTLVRNVMAPGLRVLDGSASPVVQNASAFVVFDAYSRTRKTLRAHAIDRVVVDAFSLRSIGST